MKPKLFVLLTILLSIQVKAQEKPLHLINAKLGLSHMAFSNRYLSYLNGSGMLAQCALGYSREANKSYFGFHANLTSGETTSDYEHFSPSFLNISIQMDYARMINLRAERSKIYIGMGLTSEAWLFQDNFEDIVDLVSLIPSHNVELTGRWICWINEKSSFVYQSRLGLVSLVAVQPYAGFDEAWIERAEDLSLFVSGELLSFGSQFRLQNTFTYNRELGPKYRMAANVDFGIYRLDSYRTVAFVSQALSLTISRKF